MREYKQLRLNMLLWTQFIPILESKVDYTNTLFLRLVEHSHIDGYLLWNGPYED